MILEIINGLIPLALIAWAIISALSGDFETVRFSVTIALIWMVGEEIADVKTEIENLKNKK